VILAYHSFSHELQYLDMAVPAPLFLKQVQYLSKAFRVRTLSKCLAAYERRATSRHDYVAITVDDGYADNFNTLMEAVEKYDVPSTVYLTTDCIDRREPSAALWIMLAIHHAKVAVIHLPELVTEPKWIRTWEEKESAIREIDRALKLHPEERQRALIECLLKRSGSADHVREIAPYRMLSWDQVRLMHSKGIEFGGHTRTHPVLSGLTLRNLHDEIEGSIQRVKDVLGVKAVTFAYPYGDSTRVGDRVIKVCKASGASAAVMLTRGQLSRDKWFSIPRTMITSDRSVTPWGTFSRAMWACEMEGLVDLPRDLAAGCRHLFRRILLLAFTMVRFVENHCCGDVTSYSL
jgi:peptidoglycan/xylan/chitin deacetylase (PgdA/CDA1 family)